MFKILWSPKNTPMGDKSQREGHQVYFNISFEINPPHTQ